MRSKTILIIASMAVLFLAVSFTAAASAVDDRPDFTIGKKGDIHFNITVRAGNTLLQPGMYRIQHGVEGTDHWVSFNKVDMPAGYRHSNNPVSEYAAAHVKCTVVPLDSKVGRTSVTLRTNAAGEKEVAEVQVAGETVKHVF